MENKTLQKEEEKLKEAIRDLQRNLSRDLQQGYYYGMDQKIRTIQKALSLSLRV